MIRKKSIFSFLTLSAMLLLAAGPAVATPAEPGPAVETGVIYLGGKLDKQSGREVEGYKFIHYKKDFLRGGNNAKKPRGNTCHSFLASGAKWRSIESWVMNPTNLEGLDEATLFNLEDLALQKWEDAADGAVSDGNGVQIFGGGSFTGAVLVADEVAPDGVNEVYFGDASGTGAIAVTIVWGVFSGPEQFRYLAEWDQIYDEQDFDWSVSGDPIKVDFDNVATHEVGHAGGMGHPASTCIDETMYAYASEGETKKRDLNVGDIAGINKLY